MKGRVLLALLLWAITLRGTILNTQAENARQGGVGGCD